jgi:hypothetical protein
MGKFLSLLIFKIILVLFIIFTAVKLVVVILVESISGLSAHQEENLEKLSQSPIGNNVLIESLDDGSPAYYNSNILGRYMRKDYGNFGKDSETIT